MTLYSLNLNGRVVLEVEMDVACLLPIKPRLNRRWLKNVVGAALHRCMAGS